jgi:hypothetical protein
LVIFTIITPPDVLADSSADPLPKTGQRQECVKEFLGSRIDGTLELRKFIGRRGLENTSKKVNSSVEKVK